MIFNLLLRFYVFTLTSWEKHNMARDEKTSPKILTLLAKDDDTFVLWRVADNPNTPAETLTLMAKNGSSGVRWGVASNPNTPPETLTFLASDLKEYVRGGVASNPNTPDYVKKYVIARNFMENYL